MQVQALFKKSAPAAKPAKKAGTTKKAVVKPSGGSKATRGWLGGAGGASNLDKWYGAYRWNTGSNPGLPDGPFAVLSVWKASSVLRAFTELQMGPPAAASRQWPRLHRG
jgi:hypothetical protein